MLTRVADQRKMVEMLLGREEVGNHLIILHAFEVVKRGSGLRELREEVSKNGHDLEMVSKIVLATITNIPVAADLNLKIWGETFNTDCGLEGETPLYILGLAWGIIKSANWLLYRDDDNSRFHEMMPEVLKNMILCQRKEVLSANILFAGHMGTTYKTAINELGNELKRYLTRICSFPDDKSVLFRRSFLHTISDLIFKLASPGDIIEEKGLKVSLSKLGSLVFEQTRYAIFNALNPIDQLKAILWIQNDPHLELVAHDHKHK